MIEAKKTGHTSKIKIVNVPRNLGSFKHCTVITEATILPLNIQVLYFLGEVCISEFLFL